MMDELNQQYLASLLERSDQLKAMVRELREGNSAATEQIRRLAHSLYGSGGTYGYPELSTAAGMVEHAPDTDLLKHVIALLTVLKHLTQSIPADGSPLPVSESGGRLLLIDDDDDMVQMLTRQLRQTHPNLAVTSASTAAEGMDLLLKQSYSLTILDLILPDRDGRDLLRAIKIEFKLTSPVIVLSAVDRDVVRVECMALGAAHFFTKPVEPRAFAAAVSNTLKLRGSGSLSLVPKGQENSSEARPPLAAQPLPGAMDKAARVLVIDDDQTQVNLIKLKLERQGIEVNYALNGTEGLAILQEQPAHLIILDVQMPGVSGFDVLKKIRSVDYLKQIPVIMLTAMGGEADIIRGYELGADDYILKPFSAIQLVARVKFLLKAGRPR